MFPPLIWAVAVTGRRNIITALGFGRRVRPSGKEDGSLIIGRACVEVEAIQAMSLRLLVVFLVEELA